MRISIPVPQLQIDFVFALEQIRGLYLQHTLSEAVGKLDIRRIDAELAQFVPSVSLTELATRGLRGELIRGPRSPVQLTPPAWLLPSAARVHSEGVLHSTVWSHWVQIHGGEGRVLTAGQTKRLDELCSALVGSAAALLDGVGVDRITRELLEDLALLTVGPQLRGGHHVKLGLAGIVKVFDAISSIVAHTAVTTEPICIELRNAAGRRVLIEFSSDPDIIIREEMAPDAYRNIIAIEVKGGMDFSNIHNPEYKRPALYRCHRLLCMYPTGPKRTRFTSQQRRPYSFILYRQQPLACRCRDQSLRSPRRSCARASRFSRGAVSRVWLGRLGFLSGTKLQLGICAQSPIVPN